MKPYLFLLPVTLIAACSAPETVSFETGTCGAVTAVLEAGTASDPYTSLRGEAVMLGERELEDNWTTTTPVFGEACTTAVMRDMFGTDIFMLNCPLYAESSSFDRDIHEAEARAVAEHTVGILTECLGDDWIIKETTEHNDYQVYHKYVFEPASGRPGADEFNFTVDPIYVEMSYTPYMRGRGGASGWQTLIQFQEQRETSDGN